MHKKHFNQGRAMSMPAGIGIGTAVSLVIAVIGAALAAWLVISQRIGEDGIGWCWMVILPLASIGGCTTAWRLIKHRRLMVCSVQCAAFYLVLAALALPFGGQFEGMGIHALLILLGGALSLIPGLLGSKSGAQSYHKAAFR